MSADKPLEGQIAIVTGASSGLGYRFARVIAGAGATVVATARRLDRLEGLAAEAAEAGENIVPLQMDVSDAESIASGVQKIVDEVGLPTILVNNAGIPDAKRAHKMPLELVDAVLDTNIRGVWLLSTDIGGRLIAEGKPGRMINISSMGAFNYSGAGAALYSVTKAAVVRITEALAAEWSPNHINVNAIAPGAFASEMMDGMIERTGRHPSDYTPRKRLLDATGLDSTILYLLSPASEYVTGTVLKVDDGQSPR